MSWGAFIHVEETENTQRVFGLVHAEPCGDSVELYTQIHVNVAEVTGFEGALEMALQLGDEPEVAPGN